MTLAQGVGLDRGWPGDRAAAAPLLKKVHLECGGNNALLVLPDADVKAAASAAAWGSFLHRGRSA